MSNPRVCIPAVVQEIYDDCRSNIDAYDSPTGIELVVGGIGWLVTYWPTSSRSSESLSLTRDWPTLSRPVAYGIMPDGYVTKCDAVLNRRDGGVYFDLEAEKVMTDIYEVFTLQAVVKAAHFLHRP
jgi:hypothetical protein